MKKLAQSVNTRSAKALIFFVLFLASLTSSAQLYLTLTITDNLITNAFSFDPPKPADAKSNFQITGEKGIQVFFYFNTKGTEETGSNGSRIRLIAYKIDSGNEEWFNELTYLIKKNDKYGIVAMNFFKTGKYKVVILDNLDKTKVLASGTFTVEKN